MTSTDIATTNKPPSDQRNSKPGRVTGRLRTALLSMVWDNLTDNEAAVKTGMTVTAIRLAMKRAHVAQFVRSEREVLLGRERLRNPHRLIATADQTSNHAARVQAVRLLEDMDQEMAARTGAGRSAGITIQIINQSASEARPVTTIDVVSAGRDDLSPDTSST